MVIITKCTVFEPTPLKRFTSLPSRCRRQLLTICGIWQVCVTCCQIACCLSNRIICFVRDSAKVHSEQTRMAAQKPRELSRHWKATCGNHFNTPRSFSSVVWIHFRLDARGGILGFWPRALTFQQGQYI